MDEIVDHLANNVLAIVIIGLVLLLLKLLIVILLIKTKKPALRLSGKSFKTVFAKTYSSDDIKKSKDPKRVLFKRINNAFKVITYVWLIILCVTIFFKFAASRDSSDTPVENNRPTQSNTEE